MIKDLSVTHNHRPISEAPFNWGFTSRPMVARCFMFTRNLLVVQVLSVTFRATIGPSAKRHLIDVLLAGRWWFAPKCLLETYKLVVQDFYVTLRATIGPSAKRHLIGVSLAGRWWSARNLLVSDPGFICHSSPDSCSGYLLAPDRVVANSARQNLWHTAWSTRQVEMNVITLKIRNSL